MIHIAYKYYFLIITLVTLFAGCGATPPPNNSVNEPINQTQQNQDQTSKKVKPKIDKAAKQTFLEASQLASGARPDYPNAIRMYEEAYTKDKNLKIALYNIAFLYSEMKNKEKAIEFYKMAAEAGVGDGWVDIGLMQLASNNVGAAESSFRRALTVEPLNGRAHLNLAVINKNRKNYDEAVAGVRNALKEDGTNADAYGVLAQVYYELGRYKLALLVANAGLAELDPENSSLWTTQGLIHLKLDDLIKAIKSFNQAIKFDNKNFAARLNLGIITFGYRDYEKSYNLLREAVSLRPNHIEANLSKAVAARTLNRLDEARQGYEKVLSLSPNHPAALFNLTVLQQDYTDIQGFDARTANVQKAIQQYEKILNFTSEKTLRKKVVQRIEEAKIILESIVAEKEMAASEAASEAANTPASTPASTPAPAPAPAK